MRLEIRGEYAVDWPEIADRTRAEAGGRCIRCGHPHDPQGIVPCDDGCDGRRHSRRPRRALTVHHLDGDKSNNRWWNLLALCQGCHLSVQARVLPERPWLWDHTAWFEVYAAGFFASYYGGFEVTRREAETRLDELLLLGQPWRDGT